MKTILVVSVVVVSLALAGSVGAQTGFSPPGAERGAGGARSMAPNGLVGTELFVRGRFAGRIDHGRINCLGHAAGLNASVQTGTLPLGDTLRALGYSCKAAEPESLATAIADRKTVMMVYFYTYPDAFRPAADRGVEVVALAARYGWKSEPWKQKEIFSDESGDLPFDFHAIGYDHELGEWSWVMHARPKDPDGSYRVDSEPGMAATLDPDLYFPADHVVTKLACIAE